MLFFDVSDPIFFNFICVNVFIGVSHVFELIPSSVSPSEVLAAFIFSTTFSSFVGYLIVFRIFFTVFSFFLKFSLCLNDEAKHLALY